MPALLGAFVLGTPRPVELAAFYAALLGWDTVSADPDWVRLRDPGRERPGLSFQREPGDVPPTWPARAGGVQLQAHLDVQVDDLEAETARAVTLGATVESHQPAGPDVRVLRDPHGHLFCLFLPGA